MDHPMVRVTNFAIVGPYTLRITFDDGTAQTIDFEAVLSGFYYARLRDLALFNQVRLDPEIHSLVWPNDADFDPATLYDWHRGAGTELAQRALRWRRGSRAAKKVSSPRQRKKRLSRA